MRKKKVLCLIHARGSSTRLPGKNIRPFAGVPLVARTVKQALALPFIDRVILDTDSPEVATIGKRAGAEVPFLRPKHLATSTSQMIDTIIFMLKKLRVEEGYVPDYCLILPPNLPLREIKDIEEHWRVMQEEEKKKNGATSVVTICPTHPRLYHLDTKGIIHLENKTRVASSNTQAWKPGFILNGCFVFLIRTDVLLREKQYISKKARGVIVPRWRSIDIDYPEDWVIGELLYHNKEKIKRELKKYERTKKG